MRALHVDDVSFSYSNDLLVIDGLDMRIDARVNVGIVGPSGSGKSTLLRLIAGLERPAAGRIDLRAPTGQHPVSLLFQQDTLLPWRTVEQNVGLYYSLHRDQRGSESKRHCGSMLSAVGLDGFANAYPHQLSGGMRRRVAMLCALAANPAFLLLDEPFSSVDEPTRIAIHQELLDMLADVGSSMVLVTHDVHEAISLCDRVLVLSARPARVVSEYDTSPVGDRRDLLELRSRPEYLEVYSKIWSDLATQIRSSSTGT
jgi:NitT/TauT family transport system ATP-binding protein